MPSLDELIALVESRGRNTAVDPETMGQYEEAKFLKEQEGRQNARIAKSAGIPERAIEGMSRRDVQRVVAEMRTRSRDKEDTALKGKYGTTERGLIKKLEGKGPFRDEKDTARMAFTDPEALNAETDDLEALMFPRGRAHSDRPNVDQIAGMFDAARAQAETGPKSADVTAQRAAAALPEFEGISTTDADKRLVDDLTKGRRSSGEVATIRTALKPRAALEEEELMARMRPDAESYARETDAFQAADDLLAPLADATKLSMPEVRARKRLATEIQRRAVDPMDIEGMRNPRALPAQQRARNPLGPPTVVNPEGQAPGPLDQANMDLFDAQQEPGAEAYQGGAVPTAYELANKKRKRPQDEQDEFSRMFGPGGA